MTLLHDVKLSGLDCKLPVVHANDKLLLALSRLGVGKGELRLSLSNPQSLFFIRYCAATLDVIALVQARSNTIEVGVNGCVMKASWFSVAKSR